jgi:hypothetical protein
MNSHSNLSPARRSLLGVLALGAAMYAGSVQAQAGGQPPIPAGLGMKSWQDNGAEGRYLLQVIKGQLPKTVKPITGTVTSDTDCDADAQGLSHCHNTLKLADGTELTVIDTHNMHRNRCLGSGDQLALTGLGKPWIVGTLFKR